MAIGRFALHHLAELVRLALEAEARALDLLVMFELGLEEPDHLDRGAGGPSDRDRGVPVGREDLLDAPVGDHVALGRAAVARHDDAVVVTKGHDRRAVRDARDEGRRETWGVTGFRSDDRCAGGSGQLPSGERVRRSSSTKLGPGSPPEGKGAGSYAPHLLRFSFAHSPPFWT